MWRLKTKKPASPDAGSLTVTKRNYSSAFLRCWMYSAFNFFFLLVTEGFSYSCRSLSSLMSLVFMTFLLNCLRPFSIVSPSLNTTFNMSMYK